MTVMITNGDSPPYEPTEEEERAAGIKRMTGMVQSGLCPPPTHSQRSQGHKEATIEQIALLLNSQKDSVKEERREERKTDREEIKLAVTKEILSVKTKVAEIKEDQRKVEVKIVDSNIKMNEKVDNLMIELNRMKEKVRELEKAKEEVRVIDQPTPPSLPPPSCSPPSPSLPPSSSFLPPR